MTFKADLHCHTNHSDGSFTPQELLNLAKKIGLSGLSITDHDTIAAYYDNIFDLAKKLNLQLLTGVEISSEFNGVSIHVLAYNVPLNSKLDDFLQLVREKRYQRNRLIIEKLLSKNMVITEEELINLAKENQQGMTVIGRPHIAKLLLKKGYVRSIQEAFDKYLKKGASCYASGSKFSTIEVIEKVHEVNAKAILAHPHAIKEKKVINDLLELPFDGLEGYYSRLYLHEEKKWIEIAEKKGWIITGGSDFHGDFKPRIPLGCSWVSDEVFNELQCL